MSPYETKAPSAFTYDCVFKYVVDDDTELCHGLIERLLGRKVGGLASVIVQKDVSSGEGSKEIRCDAFCRGYNGTIYDIEMQRCRQADIDKRMRGYQALLDYKMMGSGDGFSLLGELYIIFICTFDPYGQGKAEYPIEPRDVRGFELPIDAGVHWVVLNSKAAANAERPELAALLEYVEGNGVEDGDELLKRIDEKSALATADKEVRAQMRLEDKHALDLRDTERKSRAEGEQRMCELSKLLISDSRTEDLTRAVDDPAYRQQLFTEYGLE